MRRGSYSVVGMGKSGLAAARSLASRGFDVLLSDRLDTPELRAAASQLCPNVRTVFGREEVRPGDVVVLSPGIPPHADIFRKAQRLAVEVIGEVELFFRLFEGQIVAVTGTDGKSTVTTMIAHLLRTAGQNAHAAGNLGTPLCDILQGLGAKDIVVAEVSCFQLITTNRFRPFVALCTNLAPDHLDYHGSFDAYVMAKARIVQNQAAGDWFIRNLDDPIISTWLRGGSDVQPNGQTILDVSRYRAVAHGAFAAGDKLFIAKEGRARYLCKRSEIRLPGEHNIENALLAVAACIPFGVEPDALVQGLTTYSGLPHRIEFVREFRGVSFYNDSKATNPHATITALRAFSEKVILIAGGHEKWLPLQELAEEVGRRCKAVVLVGESAQRMAKEFGSSVPIEVLPDLAKGVARAFELANGKGIVLFSPAASSYDQFHDFEERGEKFRQLVNAL